MRFQLDQSIEVLAHTPAVLDALLRGKSDAWLHCRKSPEAFSPVDVIGHLMHADETDWLPRARLILEGAHTPFAPFDRFDFQRLIANKSIDTLLDDFATLRTQSLQTLTALNLTEAQLNLPGTHPELGPVTLRHLLATWVVHDLNHIQQIVRTMSNEYREAVGPWQAYLSILH
ncbi:MAG TPA: DinB family protein [Acidobacteriaceae bacterium]|nr:DinB family protein [Acidobacteriaceae bacterium]